MCSNPNAVFKSVSLLESLNLIGGKHASHCMLYSTPNSNGISFALLQLRFDGLIGFGGGEVDYQEVTVDHIIDAVNRELFEEINYQFDGVTQDDWICSHLDHNSPYILHFFAKQLTFDQILCLYKTHMNAEHFPSESLGMPSNDPILDLIEISFDLRCISCPDRRFPSKRRRIFGTIFAKPFPPKICGKCETTVDRNH